MGYKLLYIENVATVNAVNFYVAAAEAAHRMGWEFHLAYNCLDYTEEAIQQLQAEMGLIFHQTDFIRLPFDPRNIKAYRQIVDIINQEHIDIIHCNTPIGGVVGRLAGKKCHVKKIIYQAHGFHFYKGAPLLNWLLYYPAEKILAQKTDSIITINRDDFEFAKKHLHPRSEISYVPGVGIAPEQWEKPNHPKIREEMGLSEEDFVILTVGRLEKNKNGPAIIDAVRQIQNPRVKLLFCGDGEDRGMLEEKARDLGGCVKFLGNRSDMADLYHMADCFVLASFREGLSRSIMEAMACGLPCIVSNIRGNRDLIDSEGGYLIDPHRSSDIAEGLKKLLDSEEMRRKMGAHNQKKLEQFSFEKVVEKMTLIYSEQLEGKSNRQER